MSQKGRYSGKMTGGNPYPQGIQNGKIPLAFLGHCQTQRQIKNPFLFSPAAIAFDAMTRFAIKDDVHIIAIALYRDYNGQQRMKEYWKEQGKPENAATPGRSNHGWGTAADINRFANNVLPWLEKNAPRFGWDHPMWAGSAKGSYFGKEPWHWQYIQEFEIKNEIQILINGVPLVAANPYFYENGRIYCDLRDLTDALNADIIGFDRDLTVAQIAGRGHKGWVSFINKNGTGTSPISHVCDTLHVPYTWHNELKVIRINVWRN